MDRGHTKDVIVLLVVIEGCVSGDINKQFACDLDGPNTCGSGWFCERVPDSEQRGYKGICKPGSPKDIVEDARVEVWDVQDVLDRGEEKVFAEDVGVQEGVLDREKVEVWDIDGIEVVCVPTGSEKCDGIDNDCDGQTDEEGAQGCVYSYVDNDRDGFGDEATKKCLCAPTEPYTLTVGGDCDDQNAQINPSAVERCGNSVDDNCDGRTDEAGCQECSLYYKDQDADGFGVTSDSRCLREATVPYTAIRGGDCDDNDPMVNPSMEESCNGKDDNCNSLTDEEKKGGECGTHGYMLFYYDGDNDSFGVEGNAKCLCAPWGAFKAQRALDCDDQDAQVNPSMPEICSNNKDDNCNGQTDEERTSGQCGIDGYTLYYYDGDGDTYGVTGNTKCLCSPSGKYNVTRAGDCNDNHPHINPGTTEKCDGIDNDCNGQTDEERTSGQCGIDGYTLYYYDGDGDTYGVAADTKCLCSPSGKYNVTRGGDCDDGDVRINPDGVEVCDGKDNNCDGVTDPPNTPGCSTYYYDADNDTYGTSQTQCLCSASGNFRATRPGDCDDTDQRVHPGGSVCGMDGDCDGSLLDPGEVCDDGNSVRWDGCTDCLYLEFQVNTWTTSDQWYPSITSLSNGGFVVVWESWGQDGSYYGVYGQRFDSNGSKVGSEFRVNTWTTDDQWLPSITSLSNGGFVVVWASGCEPGWDLPCSATAQDGSKFGVYGQRFDSNGNKVGSEFRVNTWTTDDQWLPSITSLSNGGFVVVWSGAGQADGDGVYGQRFDANGNKVGSEFRVNTWTTGNQSGPCITTLPNGGFVVVWHSGCDSGCTGQDGSLWGVYGQRFDSYGNKVGSEFQVNTWTTDQQSWPSIASLSNGGFVVVWESGCWSGCQGQDGSGFGVYGRIFSQ